MSKIGKQQFRVADCLSAFIISATLKCPQELKREGKSKKHQQAKNASQFWKRGGRWRSVPEFAEREIFSLWKALFYSSCWLVLLDKVRF